MFQQIQSTEAIESSIEKVLTDKSYSPSALKLSAQELSLLKANSNIVVELLKKDSANRRYSLYGSISGELLSAIDTEETRTYLRSLYSSAKDETAKIDFLRSIGKTRDPLFADLLDESFKRAKTEDERLLLLPLLISKLESEVSPAADLKLLQKVFPSINVQSSKLSEVALELNKQISIQTLSQLAPLLSENDQVSANLVIEMALKQPALTSEKLLREFSNSSIKSLKINAQRCILLKSAQNGSIPPIITNLDSTDIELRNNAIRFHGRRGNQADAEALGKIALKGVSDVKSEKELIRALLEVNSDKADEVLSKHLISLPSDLLNEVVPILADDRREKLILGLKARFDDLSQANQIKLLEFSLLYEGEKGIELVRRALESNLPQVKDRAMVALSYFQNIEPLFEDRKKFGFDNYCYLLAQKIRSLDPNQSGQRSQMKELSGEFLNLDLKAENIRSPFFLELAGYAVQLSPNQEQAKKLIQLLASNRNVDSTEMVSFVILLNDQQREVFIDQYVSARISSRGSIMPLASILGPQDKTKLAVRLAQIISGKANTDQRFASQWLLEAWPDDDSRIAAIQSLPPEIVGDLPGRLKGLAISMNRQVSPDEAERILKELEERPDFANVSIRPILKSYPELVGKVDRLEERVSRVMRSISFPEESFAELVIESYDKIPARIREREFRFRSDHVPQIYNLAKRLAVDPDISTGLQIHAARILFKYPRKEDSEIRQKALDIISQRGFLVSGKAFNQSRVSFINPNFELFMMLRSETPNSRPNPAPELARWFIKEAAKGELPVEQRRLIEPVGRSYWASMENRPENFTDLFTQMRNLNPNFRILFERAKKIGWDLPFRYNQSELTDILKDREALDANLIRANEKIVVAFVGRDDWNGAISGFADQYVQMRKLGYRVLVFDADTKQDIAKAVSLLKSKGIKADLTLFEMHGSPTSLAIGPGLPPMNGKLAIVNPENNLSITDEPWLRGMGFGDILKKNSQLVFVACSAGQEQLNRLNLANMMRRLAPHLKPGGIHSPNIETSIQGFKFDSLGNFSGAIWQDESSSRAIDYRASIKTQPVNTAAD